MKKVTRQCFNIEASIWEGLTYEEVEATFYDMVDMGIASPPFREFDIVIPASACVKVIDEDGATKEVPDGVEMMRHSFTMLMDMPDPETLHSFEYKISIQRHGREIDLVKGIENEDRITPEEREWYRHQWTMQASHVYRGLITLLATKNIVKQVKEHKLVARGIGKGKYSRTTTLRIGAVTEHVNGERTEGNSEIATRRPHLRRGHIRQQKYGPKNQLVRRIFIEPIFVNADANWIQERTAYNVVKG